MTTRSSWALLSFALARRFTPAARFIEHTPADPQSTVRSPRQDPREDPSWPHVPRVIFQIWYQADSTRKTRPTRPTLPPNFAAWSRSFRARNPGYECLIWDDADNRSFIVEQFPWFLPWYDAYPAEIFRADVVRFFFLYRFGGIYADMDTECLKPLDPLLSAGEVILGRMGLDAHFDHAIPNAMMAAKPRHLFWLLAISIAIERAKTAGSATEQLRSGPERVTGPVVLKETVDAYSQSTRDQVRQRARWVVDQVTAGGLPPLLAGDVKLLSPELWYPLDWSNPFHNAFRSTLLAKRIILTEEQTARLFPQAYLVTYWAHSW